MLAKMRNSALSMEENAYPQTLSAAYRIASGWINEDIDRGFNGNESHSALVFENPDAPKVDKAPTTTADDKKKSALKMKWAVEIVCYVCKSTGYYDRDCPKKKAVKASALVTDHSSDNIEEG